MTDTEEAGAVARALAEAIWGDRDLRAARRLMDPTFRLCLVQQWIWDNREEVEADGLDRDGLAEALSVPEPTDPLWLDFEGVHMRGFSLWPNLSEWGVTTAQRLVKPGVELILYVPPGITEIPVGGVFEGHPCLVRKGVEGWRVANLLSETQVPEPGWPPKLQDPDLDGTRQLPLRF